MSQYNIKTSGVTSSFVQQASLFNSSLASTSAQLAATLSTLPTTSDGTSWETLSITPVSTDNYLLIEGTIATTWANATGSQIAIFDGISSNAIGTFYLNGISTLSIGTIPFRFLYQPVSTDTLTFTLRYGVTAASTSPVMVINGFLSVATPTQMGAGVCYSSWTLTEINP